MDSLTPISILLFVAAGCFFCYGVYGLLKSWLKFGEPYSSWRKEMEVIREELRIKSHTGEYSFEEVSRLAEKFNHNARHLRIPEFSLKS